jgi:predicted outer membrane repeat protein
MNPRKSGREPEFTALCVTGSLKIEEFFLEVFPMRALVLSGVLRKHLRVLRLNFAAVVCLLVCAASASATTYTVTSTADTTASGTLRWAMTQVNGDSSADTIDLTGVTGTITLTSALPAIFNSVTISGPGASSLTINGAGAYSVFIAQATTITISGLTIENGVGYFDGSATFGGGLMIIQGNITVSQCVFTGNSSTNGGAIYNQDTLTVESSSFSGNSSPSIGGAIKNVLAMTITDSTFTGNSAPYGGAIISYVGPVTAARNTFLNNVGTTEGGAFDNVSGTAATFNETFVGNSSPYAGAIYNGDGANLTASESTFYANSASSAGGAILNNGGGTLTAQNDIFSGNSSADGGGIYNVATATLGNDVFYNNSGSDVVGVTLDSSDVTGHDPKLAPLGNYGGATQTMALLPGSAAICVGASADVPNFITTDQRGFGFDASCASGSVDAGAVETNQFVVTNTNDSGAGSLRAAITNADSATMGDIGFASGVSGTIGLASGLPAIGGVVNVLAPLTPGITVSGSGSFLPFTVNSGANSFLYGLTISSGFGYSGGGIYNNGTLTLSSVTVSGNSTGSGYDGGGIYNDSQGTLIVDQSTISANAAPFGSGGGIFNLSFVTLNDSTLSGNSAVDGAGGGIYNLGSVAVKISTVSGNSASGGTGGGLYNVAAMTVSDSIVSGNSGGDIGGSYTDGGGNQIGVSGINLAPLGNYGGPTQTMLPEPGSPAICAGSIGLIPAGFTTDQRGYQRTMNYNGTNCVDSGAVQTTYALAFTVEPPSPSYIDEAMRPSPRVELTESGVPFTAGTGTVTMMDATPFLTGNTTASLSSGVAIFGDLTTNVPTTNDTLTASLPLTTSITLQAQSTPFDSNPPNGATLSPASGSTLTSASTTFSWSGGLGIEDYELLIGTTGVGSDNVYNSGPTLATSETVNVPAIGATLYVRFRQMGAGGWEQNDYTYSEAGGTAATITLPTNGSTLTSSGTTFTWTGGVGVRDYELYVGTAEAGSDNVYNSGVIQATSETVTVPAIGAPLYVLLRQLINGAWQNSYYTYTESGAPTAATITSPANGSTLSGSSVTFTWTGGVGVQDYDLTVGTTGVGSDNVYDSYVTQATQETVTVPTTGGKLYVRLRQRLNGMWTNTDYMYTEQ